MRHKRCWRCEQKFFSVRESCNHFIKRFPDAWRVGNSVRDEKLSRQHPRPATRQRPAVTTRAVNPSPDLKSGHAIQHQRSSAEQEHGRLSDEPCVRKALLRMVLARGKFPRSRKICCRRRWLIFGRASGSTQGNGWGGICKALTFISTTSGHPDAAWTHPSAAGPRQPLRTTALDGTNGWIFSISTKALCPKYRPAISFRC